MNKMIKKLIYKSHYRGTKEGDFLLSSFAKIALIKCTMDELKLYDKLLECRDAEIHEWVLSPQKSPIHLKYIIQKIADFHNLDVSRLTI